MSLLSTPSKYTDELSPQPVTVPAPKPTLKEANETEKTKPKIAFIDDEKRILRSLKMFFRQTHDVFITTDPEALFDYVANNNVQVVVSDQRMPDIQGTEVLQRVKDIAPNAIRILLTGYADLNAIVDSVNDGEIYRYITKPWHNDELKDIITKATAIAQKTEGVDYSDVEVATNAVKRVLILDDKETTYLQMKNKFSSKYELEWAPTLDKAAELLGRHEFAVAIADITLDGDEIAPIVYELKNIQPDLMMLMLTQYQDAHLLIDLINKGQIFRCLPRPTNLSIMGISLDRAYQHHLKMQREPSMAARHEVDAIPETQLSSFSGRIKKFLSRFSLRGRYSF